jgi:NADPH:quinone reductase-like Zn-dependent oxidoreductase
VLKPIVDRVLAFDLVQEAHVAMEANSNNGKIVLIVDPAVNAEGEGARSDL